MPRRPEHCIICLTDFEESSQARGGPEGVGRKGTGRMDFRMDVKSELKEV